MGCDIHMIAEVKKTNWNPNKEKVFSEYDWVDGEPVYKPSSKPPTPRNYDWFAVLANVRNGRGFAGCVTGEGFEVIAMPRGIPEDCSKKWRKECEEWGVDFHSHSYLYLSDFESFDWNQVSMCSGIIPLSEYEKLREKGSAPDSYSGGISGPNVITVSEKQADKILSGETTEVVRKPSFWDRSKVCETRPSKEWDIYVSYNWPVIYGEWFKRELKSTVEPLKKLSEIYGKENVRLVFAFDN